MTTVIETLENGKYNLENAVISMQIDIGNDQIQNYEIAKQLGANDSDNIKDWMEQIENYKKGK